MSETLWSEPGKSIPSPRTGHNIGGGFERKASAHWLKCLELGHKLKYELNAKGSMVSLAKNFDLRRKLKLEQCQPRSVRGKNLPGRKHTLLFQPFLQANLPVFSDIVHSLLNTPSNCFLGQGAPLEETWTFRPHDGMHNILLLRRYSDPYQCGVFPLKISFPEQFFVRSSSVNLFYIVISKAKPNDYFRLLLTLRLPNSASFRFNAFCTVGADALSLMILAIISAEGKLFAVAISIQYIRL